MSSLSLCSHLFLGFLSRLSKVYLSLYHPTELLFCISLKCYIYMHGAIYTCMGLYMATDDLLLKFAKTGAACSCYFLLKHNFSDIT